MFSLTPLRFNSISCSGSTRKLLGRLLMIAITVFYLKPARTNLTTGALVSGACGRCAFAEAHSKQQTVAVRSSLNSTFISLSGGQEPATTVMGAVPGFAGVAGRA